MHTALVVASFVTGFLFIFGANLFMADLIESHRQKVRQRLEEEMRQRLIRRVDVNAIYDMAAQGLTEAQFGPTLRERFKQFFEQSGMAIRPAHLVVFSLGLFLLPFPPGWYFHQLGPALAAASVAASLPFLWVMLARTFRIQKLLSQLPDAFDLMSRTMKCGNTIPQAMESVSDEFPSPVSDEFRLCYQQQNLGLSPEAALRDLARRTGLLELKIFVLAVTIHEQTGGNLSELLEKLASLIRGRERIRGLIGALTAEGRLQALILLCLPPGMLAIMLVINRPYAMVLFEHPALLVGAALSMTFGAVWMQKIIHFDF